MNSATTTKATKTVTLRDLQDRDYVRGGTKYEGRKTVGNHAEVIVGVSIRLFGTYKTYPFSKELGRTVETEVIYDRTFALGDSAEYDSYNMAYTGKIVAVGEKTVTIDDDGKVRRLSIFEFSNRNRDLDLEVIAARNLDVMMTC